MGEVYRAKDTKLDREVAIKVLPQAFAKDRERVERFQREAKLLAQLNHTNIATIHGLEEIDGQRLLVMELVEGETLAERIARGPVSIDDAILIFTQIAEGLEAAHNKGIIHRDLKPANVMITPDGHVKILDFGLAKAFHDETGLGDDASQSPTMTRGTALGVILGTASYMSPEQARGKSVDKRTDLWAFGCCLYEALVGRKAFVGETTTDTLAAIVNAEPDWNGLPEATPVSARRLLRRCLAKNVRERLTDAGMARIELNEPRSADASPVVVRGRSWRRASVWLLVGVILSAAAVTLLREPSDLEVRRVAINAPPGFSIDDASSIAHVDISPDGKWIAYIATSAGGERELYLRGIDDFAAKRVGDASSRPVRPRFSPDSQRLGYFDPRGQLMGVLTEGDRPELVCQTGAAGLLAFGGFDWSENGSVVFSRRLEGLWRCPVGSREPEPITTVNFDAGELNHVGPHVLPGGETIVFAVRTGSGEPILAVVPDGGGEHRLLGVAGTDPRYVPSGYIVYGYEGGLRAIAFDLSKLEVAGESFPLSTGVATTQESADFAISDDGSLIYVPGFYKSADSAERSLVWVDRNGRTESIASPQMPYTRLQISLRGDRVALEARGASADVWVWDFERETLIRVTFDPAIEGYPVWSSDETLVFESHRVAQGNVYEKASDGRGTADRLVESPYHQVPHSVSPDGKWLVIEERIGGGGQADIAILSRETGMQKHVWPPASRRRAPRSPPTGAGWLITRMNRASPKSMCVLFLKSTKASGRFPLREDPIRSGPIRDGSSSFSMRRDSSRWWTCAQVMASPLAGRKGFWSAASTSPAQRSCTTSRTTGSGS